MNSPTKKAAAKEDYFDIRKLFKVLDANKWTEGKNFMKFWVQGASKIAKIDSSKKKSTIGSNLNNNLRIYTVTWNWLEQFASANSGNASLFNTRIQNIRVKSLLKHKYGGLRKQNVISVFFNEWLVHGLAPEKYLSKIKQEQLQYMEVNPYKMNGGKFNDLVAAINGFNFFAFYKGQTINAVLYRLKKAEQDKAKQDKVKQCFENIQLKGIPAQLIAQVETYLKNPKVNSIIHISHIGVYAGDIYEFNGSQYLASWDIVSNTVSISYLDALVGSSDTDDDTDLAITNKTYNIYRDKTGQGGDFIALTPIKLVEFPIIIPVY